MKAVKITLTVLIFAVLIASSIGCTTEQVVRTSMQYQARSTPSVAGRYVTVTEVLSMFDTTATAVEALCWLENNPWKSVEDLTAYLVLGFVVGEGWFSDVGDRLYLTGNTKQVYVRCLGGTHTFVQVRAPDNERLWWTPELAIEMFTDL